MSTGRTMHLAASRLYVDRILRGTKPSDLRCGFNGIRTSHKSQSGKGDRSRNFARDVIAPTGSSSEHTCDGATSSPSGRRGGGVAAGCQAQRAVKAHRRMNLAPDDDEGQARIAAFQDSLRQLGGQKAAISNLNTFGMPETRSRAHVSKGVGRSASGRNFGRRDTGDGGGLQETRDIPVVFVSVSDQWTSLRKACRGPAAMPPVSRSPSFQSARSWRRRLSKSPGVTRIALYNPDASGRFAGFIASHRGAVARGNWSAPCSRHGGDRRSCCHRAGRRRWCAVPADTFLTANQLTCWPWHVTMARHL